MSPEVEAAVPRSWLDAVVHATDSAVVSADANGTIRTWNPAAATLFGYRQQEMIGRSLGGLFAEPQVFEALLVQVRRDGRVVLRDTLRRRRDGTVVSVSETVSAVRDPDGEIAGVVIISNDISDRRELEAELAASRRALQANNAELRRSNEELEQVAYIASHDLSEPLRTIAGMVQLLAKRYEGQLDDEADELIALAVDGCRRLRAMIDDLLAYSKVTRKPLDLAPADTATILTRVVEFDLQSELHDAGATVEHHDLPVVTVDASQLEVVFRNLVSNAVKFRQNGVLPRVVVRAVASGDAREFVVDDNGIGIDSDYRDRVFRMFQRLHTSDRYSGTGIGLAVVQRIVERHGGRVWITDSDLGGTSVHFTLPERRHDAG